MARRVVNGVLLVDKPVGPSSTQALGRAKWLLNAAKAGHTGTLDPLASGLLPLCFGEATKFSADLLDADKAYRAHVVLGAKTTTGDREGEVLERRAVTVDDATVQAVVARFLGDILQVPPMYSALKRDGRPLYAYAREGIELTREARPVRILSVSAGPITDDRFELQVRCSKGTYIRTLAEDIGDALGCGAHLGSLRRTELGPFEVSHAVTLEALEAASDRSAMLKPVDLLVQSLPAQRLDARQSAHFRNGRSVLVESGSEGLCRVYDEHQRFIGTASISGPPWMLQPKRLVSLETPT